MIERFVIWLVFVLVLLACSWARPNATRIVLGFFFMAMGIGFHLVLVLLNPHAYDGYTTSALVPLYRWAFSTIVVRAPLLFAVLAAGFEIGVGLLMLGKHGAVTLGMIGAACFCS